MPFQKLVDCACAPYIRDVALDEIHTCRKAGVVSMLNCSRHVQYVYLCYYLALLWLSRENGVCKKKQRHSVSASV